MLVEDDVYQMGEHFTAAQYESVVWTLVGSAESPSGVPEVLVTQNTRVLPYILRLPRVNESDCRACTRLSSVWSS
jgi:hypothetical protein